MGQKYNKDIPRTIYICVNKDCMKKWIFVTSSEEINVIELETKKCGSCQNPVKKEQMSNECNGQPDAIMSKDEEIVNKTSVVLKNKDGKSLVVTSEIKKNNKSSFVAPKNKEDATLAATLRTTVNVTESSALTIQKKKIVSQSNRMSQNKENSNPPTIAQTVIQDANKKDAIMHPSLPSKLKLPKEDEGVIHSWKKFTLYQCTKDECGANWTSVHGWTEGYTQRCRKSRNGIPCGNPGRSLGIRKIQVVEDPSKNKSYPYWRTVQAGRHCSAFCDMCAKIQMHGAGICTNKTDVFIRNNGMNNEAIDCVEGPPPFPFPYSEM